MNEHALFQTEGQRWYYGERQTPEWARMSEAVKRRDGYKCRICGCKDNLEPHHIRYTDSLGNPCLYNLFNVVTLCRQCHQIITDAVNRASEMKVTVSVDITKPYQVEYKIKAAKSDFIADVLFNLWKRTLQDDCEWRNFRDLHTMYGVGNLLISTLTYQVGRGVESFQVSYAARVQKLITDYMAEAYRHYKADGWTDADIARFLHLEYAKIAKVREHAARLTDGCEPSG